MAKKIKVTQIRNGKRVTFLTPDKGKPGKTPKSEQWYQPGVETGWKKEMPEGERRRLVLQAHKGDELSSARSMQAKANVTTDRETKQRARADAQYFFRRHRIGKGAVVPRQKVKRRKPTNLQHIHARRSTQAQIRDEQQRHQVTIEVDSPRVKVWLKDPSAADIKGIDTPGARTLRRKGTPRITPRTPRLRR